MAHTLIAGYNEVAESHYYAITADILVGLTYKNLDVFYLISKA